MENSGLNYLKMAQPAIFLSIFLTLICYSISLYLLPLSYGKLKSNLESLKEGYTTSLLHSQAFNPISKHVTLYFDKKLKDSTLNGLVIFDYRELDKPAIIFAKYGKIIIKQNNFIFRLLKGSRQTTSVEGHINLMNFDDLIVNIQTTTAKRERTSSDIQEKYLNELFNPNIEEDILRVSKFRSEGHQRLAWPLFNIILVMVSLAIIIPSAYNRRASFKPILIASCVAITIIIVNFTLSNLSIKNNWLDYFIYLNLAIAFIISYKKLCEVK